MKNYIVPFIFSTVAGLYVFQLGSFTFLLTDDWYNIVRQSSFLTWAAIQYLITIFITMIIIFIALAFNTRFFKFTVSLIIFLLCAEFARVAGQIYYNLQDHMILNNLGIRAAFIFLLLIGLDSFYEQKALNKSINAGAPAAPDERTARPL